MINKKIENTKKYNINKVFPPIHSKSAINVGLTPTSFSVPMFDRL